MPQKLSERPEALVRQFFVDTLDPTEMEGYDPTQTDQTADDFLPITNNWDDYGDYYPMIVVQSTDGPTLPNSGNTNYNGQQGDGSGPNQYTIFPVTVSVQATQGRSYLNGVDADDLTWTIYEECRSKTQNNATTAVSEGLHTGLTPPTQTRSTEETDSGSTETWTQQQGTCNVGVLYTP